MKLKRKLPACLFSVHSYINKRIVFSHLFPCVCHCALCRLCVLCYCLLVIIVNGNLLSIDFTWLNKKKQKKKNGDRFDLRLLNMFPLCTLFNLNERSSLPPASAVRGEALFAAHIPVTLDEPSEGGEVTGLWRDKGLSFPWKVCVCVATTTLYTCWKYTSACVMSIHPGGDWPRGKLSVTRFKGSSGPFTLINYSILVNPV